MSTEVSSESGIISAIQTIQKGEVPTNDQINSTLESSIEAIEQRRKETALNAHGDTLALDAENTLKKAQEFINAKNADEVFQDLFYKSKKGALEAEVKAMRVKEDLENKVEKDVKEVKESAQDILYIGKRVSYEIVKSREFRRLLLDTLELLQSVFYRAVDVAQEGGEKLKDSVQKDFEKKDLNAEETKEAAKEIKEKLEDGLMTKEERDQLWNRLERILKKIQSNDDYKMAVNGIFSLIDQLKEKVDEFQVDPKLKEDLKHNDNAAEAWKDAKVIIERFSGEGTVDPIIKDLKKFYKLLSEDARAKSVFKDGKDLTIRSFKNPKLLQDASFRKQFESLFDKSRSLTNDKRYEKLFKEIFDKLSSLLESIKDDQLSNELGASIKKFATDIALDSNGKVSFGGIQDSLVQLKNLLVPVIARQLTAIPIARIDGKTEKYDFAAENVVFSAYDVLPDYLKLYFQTMINIDLKEASTDKAKAFLRLELHNIKCHLKDVHFAYRRKVFPSIEDDGIADIDLGGKGMSLVMDWVVSGGEKEHTSLRVKSIDVTIDDLTVTIKKAQHDIIDKLAVKVFNKQMKSEIEDELEVQLKYFGRYIADTLNDAFISVAKPSRG
jgi:hypothetical protein